MSLPLDPPLCKNTGLVHTFASQQYLKFGGFCSCASGYMFNIPIFEWFEASLICMKHSLFPSGLWELVQTALNICYRAENM